MKIEYPSMDDDTPYAFSVEDCVDMPMLIQGRTFTKCDLTEICTLMEGGKVVFRDCTFDGIDVTSFHTRHCFYTNCIYHATTCQASFTEDITALFMNCIFVGENSSLAGFSQ